MMYGSRKRIWLEETSGRVERGVMEVLVAAVNNRDYYELGQLIEWW